MYAHMILHPLLYKCYDVDELSQLNSVNQKANVIKIAIFKALLQVAKSSIWSKCSEIRIKSTYNLYIFVFVHGTSSIMAIGRQTESVDIFA